MTGRAGFVWQSRLPFCRFIEDCGVPCDVITPQLLATPFFRGTFSCLIIPTGFANPRYSNLLPALRASGPRIRKFVENGGNLLVFGAALDRPDAYDWLPFPVTYRHEYRQRSVSSDPGSAAAKLIEDYDAACIECDGTFPSHGCRVAGVSEDAAVILEQKVGHGCVIVTSVHEYPSRSFIRAFCGSGTQTLF